MHCGVGPTEIVSFGGAFRTCVKGLPELEKTVGEAAFCKSEDAVEGGGVSDRISNIPFSRGFVLDLKRPDRLWSEQMIKQLQHLV